jgi:predicted transcriptional regulator
MTQRISEGPIVKAFVRQEMRERLDELAAARDVSRSVLIREALDAVYRSPMDTARALLGDPESI